MNGCEICQQPESDHPAYAAGAGVHDYQFPVTGPFPVTDMDRLARERREAGLDEGGRPLQSPTIVPHPDGGVTQVWVEETPSDRLPSYQTGRVPIQDRAPVDPADAFQRELIRRRPFLGPAVEKMARDLQKQDRPSIIRRILNATKGTT